MLTLYPYATGNRLDERNTYSYSPYFGRDLLVAWTLQRNDALQAAADRPAPVTSDQPTDRLLASLSDSLAAGTTSSTEWAQIDRLLQRFEVSKRLHGEYSAYWRPIAAAEYDGMERYLRFAEMVDLAYQASTRLQYLNVLLKCMDTLTALASRLQTSQAARLEQLIRQERSHVHQLAQRLGVDMPDAATGNQA